MVFPGIYCDHIGMPVSVGLFYSIVANFQNILKTAEEGVSVTVFSIVNGMAVRVIQRDRFLPNSR